MSLKSIRSNNTIKIALASASGFFIQGIRNILRGEDSVKIAYEASNAKEVEKCLVEIKPDCLFLDNRTIKISNKKLLNLITKEGPNIRVILFGNNVEEVSEPIRQGSSTALITGSGQVQLNDENKSSSIIYLTKETDSSQLI